MEVHVLRYNVTYVDVKGNITHSEQGILIYHLKGKKHILDPTVQENLEKYVSSKHSLECDVGYRVSFEPMMYVDEMEGIEDVED